MRDVRRVTRGDLAVQVGDATITPVPLHGDVLFDEVLPCGLPLLLIVQFRVKIDRMDLGADSLEEAHDLAYYYST